MKNHLGLEMLNSRSGILQSQYYKRFVDEQMGRINGHVHVICQRIMKVESVIIVIPVANTALGELLSNVHNAQVAQNLMELFV